MSALRWLLVLPWLVIPLSGRAMGDPFPSTAYQGPDGAVTVLRNGDVVDPYFATRALLVAVKGGLPVRAAAERWIAWLLARQEASGSFSRYCRNAGGWQPCQPADADDALLAIWLELLYAMAPAEGLPSEWQASAEAARSELGKLLDSKRGIYAISRDKQAGLLMDNVEIYAALRSVARDEQRLRQHDAARRDRRYADELERGIDAVFFRSADRTYDVSTQPGQDRDFYPYAVAQIFPILYRMPVPGMSGTAAMRRWLDRYRDDWMSFAHDEYPWGLVALAAWQVNLHAVALDWADAASPLRNGTRWNVLEEAVYAVLQQARNNPAAAREAR